MRTARVRVGLNHMEFCAGCHHGHAAHRNGVGQCFAERRVSGAWVGCECTAFVRPVPDRAQDTP